MNDWILSRMGGNLTPVLLPELRTSSMKVAKQAAIAWLKRNNQNLNMALS